MSNRLIRRALLSSSILVGCGLAAPAFAQDEPEGPGVQTAESIPAEEATTGDIVITGTLITNPNLVSSSPVNSVGEEEIDLQQANVAEELLRELPGAVPSIGSAVNNGNGGYSFVDLRGLGSNRNVVLLDGVRLVPAELLGRFDLNNIPLALIQRVDVLTGGASTTYGADAISGVVNFITRSDFTGLDVNLSQQITELGDGNVFRGDVTLGAAFDDGRGNAVLSIGYQEADPVYQGARDFSVNQYDSFTGCCAGSGTSVPSTLTGTRAITAAGTFNTTAPFTDTGADVPGDADGDGTVEPGETVPVLAPNPAGQANGGGRQINPAVGAAVTPFNPFNFNPYNIFQTPFERFNIYAAANYEVSDAIEVYTRGIFSKNTVDTIVAPSGSFGIAVVIPLSNPFLPANLRNQFCAFNVAPVVAGVNTAGAAVQGQVTYTPRFTPAQCAAAATATGPDDPNYRTVTANLSRRATEVGPRRSSYRTNFFDYRVGVRGGITESIEWDLFGSYGESEQTQAVSGYTLNSRVRQSLLTQGLGGDAVCQDESNGCVPVNFFGAAGTISPEGVDFLSESSSILTAVTLAQARGTINGDFGWTSPLGTDPISFAIGGEYREYHARQEADSLAQAGDLGGFGGAAPNIDGSFDVYEAFGELIIPLIQDRAFFENLTLEAGIRYSKYHVRAPGDPSFNTTTWKVGGQWEPFDGLKFRGNYSHAVRAPNIAELFSPVNTALTNLADDPCANLNDDATPVAGRPVPSGELLAVCLAQGAPAGQIGSIGQPTAGQANFTGGGNLDVQPEDSDSWTVGAVFQPDFIPGLSLSLDYFHIKVTGAITSPTPDDAITACFGTPDGNVFTPAAGASSTAACTQIRRNAITGQLSGDPADTPGLFLTLSNLGVLEASGVDFTANYSRDLGFAGIDLSLVLSWTDESKFQAVEGVSLNRDCVGLYSPSCASIQPEWQWSQRTTLTFDDIDVSLLWRHLSAVNYEFADTDPAFVGDIPGFGNLDFNRIDAYDYFDLTTRFAVSEEFTFTLSVQNLLDKQPPIVGNTIGSTTFNSGNTYPSTYDALGRRFVAAARLRF